MHTDTMALLLAVAAGAAIGGILRFLTTRVVDASPFPWATFIVNLVACFAASFFAFGLSGNLSETARMFISVGVLGGLSTMSTFTTETIGMLYEGSYGSLALNVLLNVAVCLAGAVAGRVLAMMM